MSINASRESRNPVEQPAAFYCVCNDGFFLGAVGMINSLRLLAHTEPIFLLDCGLTAAQRELLSPHVTLIAAPDDASPHLLKTVLPRQHPARVTVLIDTDMIVTRPLTELIETASHGRVVAFENDVERFFPEWGELLDLGPIRRQPYLSSGLVAMGDPVRAEVLGLMEDRQARVEYELTFWRRNVRDYPFLYADQDVFNAVLATRVERDRVVILDRRLAPIPSLFKQLELVEGDALRCRYEDGTEPYVLHHFFWKPWLVPMPTSIYSRLLRKLLVGPGVTVEVPRSEIPVRLRHGPLGYAAQQRVNAKYWLKRRVGRLQ